MWFGYFHCRITESLRVRFYYYTPSITHTIFCFSYHWLTVKQLNHKISQSVREKLTYCYHQPVWFIPANCSRGSGTLTSNLDQLKNAINNYPRLVPSIKKNNVLSSPQISTSGRVSDKGRKFELSFGKDKLQVTIGKSNLSRVWPSPGACLMVFNADCIIITLGPF